MWVLPAHKVRPNTTMLPARLVGSKHLVDSEGAGQF